MTLLSTILQRQLVNYRSKSCIPIDFAVKSFCCHRVDEHVVRGREDTMDVPPFAARFSESELGGHMLASADEDGSVTLCDTRKYGAKSILKVWTAHSNAIFDIAWMEGEPKLITASGDQTALLWDVEKGDKLSEFRGHSCSLKSVNFRKNDIFTFGTGARDGNIMIWDIRCNRRSEFYKPVNTIRNAHTVQLNGTRPRVRKRSRRGSAVQSNTDSQQSVTAVIFQDDNKLISAGAMDGNIKVWDLRKTYTTLRCDPMPYHVFPYPGNEPRRHGFSSLVLDSNQSRLFASCTNDRVYMYECTVFKENPVCSFDGHFNSTFYVKAALSPDNNYLLNGSSDNNAYIWNVNLPQAPPIVLKGHMSEVTSVAWCPADIGKLVTCSDDNNVRIWRMNCNQQAREKTDFVGWCEQSKPKPSSPTQLCKELVSSPGTNSLTTPSNLNSHQSRQSSLLSSPTSTLKLGSPMHVARLSLTSTTPERNQFSNPSSPKTPTTPSPGYKVQQKQQSLSSWLKQTPSKENTIESPKNSTPIVKNRILASSKNTGLKNKKSLFGEVREAKQNRELSNSEANAVVCNGERSEEYVPSGDIAAQDSTSPARKRQCMGGSSELNNCTSPTSVYDNTSISKSASVNNDKENVGPCTIKNDPTKVKTDDSCTDKNNWFTNWRSYIKHNKTDAQCTKSLKSDESEEQTDETINKTAHVVKPEQSILKYFKPTLAAIKEY